MTNRGYCTKCQARRPIIHHCCTVCGTPTRVVPVPVAA